MGEAETCAEVLELLERLQGQADVLLLDVDMPGEGGVLTTAQVCQRWPACAVVLLTGHRQFASSGLRAGARGYLLKNASVQEIVDALRAVSRGGVALASAVHPDLVATLQSDPSQMLSDHEIAILREIAQGHANAVIARRFNLTEATIKQQVSAIFRKLDANDRAHATAIALRRGLIQ